MDPIGKKLIEVAKKELGYREKSDGYTKYGDWYAKNVEDGDSYFATAPWCDMFLAWAATKAGVQDWVGEFAATIDHAQWFKKQDAWGSKPEPGTLVFFAWSGSKDLDAIGHVGLVESVDGSSLRTIEANTEGVYLKRKTRDVSDVVGYGYPGKVKVAGKSLPTAQTAQPSPTEQKYVPKHAATAPAVGALGGESQGSTVATHQADPVGPPESQIVQQEAVLGGLVALALCGSLAVAVGKSTAARIPTEPPVRVRKRGKHHRTPVALPADVTAADLTAAEAGTAVMPALTASVAAEAEDREFWGRISTLEDDQELAFWDSLHAELTPLRPRVEGPHQHHEMPARLSGPARAASP